VVARFLGPPRVRPPGPGPGPVVPSAGGAVTAATGASGLLVVGGGRMGEALVRGMLAAGRPPGEVVVLEIDPARREALARSCPDVAVAARPTPAAAAVIAVKPADVEAACRTAVDAGAGRILSIAAGVTTTSLQAFAGAGPAVLRAMPNTPALVGAGVSALCRAASAGPEDEDWAEAVLASVGRVVRLPEKLLDAATGLSGSGPAYIFLVAEALIEGGVAAGLPRPEATAMTVGTLLGAARLLAETGETPEALRAAVTSPGGTTAAGLRVLESRAVRAAFIDAVAAATERSRQLGQ